MVENPVDAVPADQDGEKACSGEETHQVTEFPSVEGYCRQLKAQGIAYQVIPMRKRNKQD